MSILCSIANYIMFYAPQFFKISITLIFDYFFWYDYYTAHVFRNFWFFGFFEDLTSYYLSSLKVIWLVRNN